MNSRPAFGICAALASTMLSRLRILGGGFNFVGETSQGKSTTVEVGASVNLTAQAFLKRTHGNLEAGFLIKPREKAWSSIFEAGGASTRGRDFLASEVIEWEDLRDLPFLQVRYDWVERTLAWWSARPLTFWFPGEEGWPAEAQVCSEGELRQWVLCPAAPAALEAFLKVRSSLPLRTQMPAAEEKVKVNVLVQETGLTHKPSLLEGLSPEKILKLWAALGGSKENDLLLAWIQERLQAQLGASLGPRFPLGDLASVFGIFARIFHSFRRFRKEIESCLQEGERRDLGRAKRMLFQPESYSLRAFIARALESQDYSLVEQYLVGLCAKECLGGLRVNGALAGHEHVLAEMNAVIESLIRKREAFVLGELHKDRNRFFQWFEQKFPEEEA